MSAVLEIINLKASFKDAHAPGKTIEAVKGVSLAIEEGRFTSIVGESGSGKSVTTLSLTRLVPSARLSGKVLWRGRDLLACGERELLDIRGREIAYVFQDPSSSLNPVLRVGSQIAEAYRAHAGAEPHAAKKRALDLLRAAQMDAPRVYQSYPHELSGGMRQRAMIAMALIADPRLLIADEPTTALDADAEAEILDLLVKIQKERKFTVLFITHDMSHAARYSDRIHVMKAGLLEETLENQSGRFVPQGGYAKKLFAAGFWDVPPKTILEI